MIQTLRRVNELAETGELWGYSSDDPYSLDLGSLDELLDWTSRRHSQTPHLVEYGSHYHPAVEQEMPVFDEMTSVPVDNLSEVHEGWIDPYMGLCSPPVS